MTKKHLGAFFVEGDISELITDNQIELLEPVFKSTKRLLGSASRIWVSRRETEVNSTL